MFLRWVGDYASDDSSFALLSNRTTCVDNTNALKKIFILQMGEPPCSLDPYSVVPEKSSFVDIQSLKLQELPEVSYAFLFPVLFEDLLSFYVLLLCRLFPPEKCPGTFSLQ